MNNLTALADEELVRLYVKGNNDAFDALLKRYDSRVFSYIFYAVKDQDLANDLFQDVFVRVISTLNSGKYSENGKFGSWIIRITHNVVIDNFRQSSQITGPSKDDEKVNILNEISLVSYDNKESDMVSGQLLKDIKALIDFLPLPQKEAIVMRFFYDMSFKEIAEATGVSISTALGRVRYGLSTLRRLARDKKVHFAS